MESVAAPKPKSRIAPEGVIIRDINCAICDYNLRGLDIDSRCPECGTPMQKAILINHLRFSSPKWVAQLAGGATWIYRAFLLAILMLIAIPLGLLAAFALGLEDRFGELASYFEMGFTSLAAIIFLGFMSIGIWKITAADPDAVPTPESLTQRQCCMVAWGGTMAIWVVTPYLKAMTESDDLGYLLRSVFEIAFIYSIFNTIHALEKRLNMGDRIPPAASAMIGWIIVKFSSMTLHFRSGLESFLASMGFQQLGPVVSWLNPFVAIGSLVLGIWTLHVVDRYKKQLREAAQFAGKKQTATLDERLMTTDRSTPG